ncbi:class I SAM-dependent methyltransferase, partial [bacterium]
ASAGRGGASPNRTRRELTGGSETDFCSRAAHLGRPETLGRAFGERAFGGAALRAYRRNDNLNRGPKSGAASADDIAKLRESLVAYRAEVERINHAMRGFPRKKELIKVYAQIKEIYARMINIMSIGGSPAKEILECLIEEHHFSHEVAAIIEERAGFVRIELEGMLRARGAYEVDTSAGVEATQMQLEQFISSGELRLREIKYFNIYLEMIGEAKRNYTDCLVLGDRIIQICNERGDDHNLYHALKAQAHHSHRLAFFMQHVLARPGDPKSCLQEAGRYYNDAGSYGKQFFGFCEYFSPSEQKEALTRAVNDYQWATISWVRRVVYQIERGEKVLTSEYAQIHEFLKQIYELIAELKSYDDKHVINLLESLSAQILYLALALARDAQASSDPSVYSKAAEFFIVKTDIEKLILEVAYKTKNAPLITDTLRRLISTFNSASKNKAEEGRFANDEDARLAAYNYSQRAYFYRQQLDRITAGPEPRGKLPVIVPFVLASLTGPLHLPAWLSVLGLIALAGLALRMARQGKAAPSPAAAPLASATPDRAVIFLIRDLQDILRETGFCLPLYLYGSAAQFGARPGHDIDIAIPFNHFTGLCLSSFDELSTAIYRRFPDCIDNPHVRLPVVPTYDLLLIYADGLSAVFGKPQNNFAFRITADKVSVFTPETMQDLVNQIICDCKIRCSDAMDYVRIDILPPLKQRFPNIDITCSSIECVAPAPPAAPAPQKNNSEQNSTRGLPFALAQALSAQYIGRPEIAAQLVYHDAKFAVDCAKEAGLTDKQQLSLGRKFSDFAYAAKAPPVFEPLNLRITPETPVDKKTGLRLLCAYQNNTILIHPILLESDEELARIFKLSTASARIFAALCLGDELLHASGQGDDHLQFMEFLGSPANRPYLLTLLLLLSSKLVVGTGRGKLLQRWIKVAGPVNFAEQQLALLYGTSRQRIHQIFKKYNVKAGKKQQRLPCINIIRLEQYLAAKKARGCAVLNQTKARLAAHFRLSVKVLEHRLHHYGLQTKIICKVDITEPGEQCREYLQGLKDQGKKTLPCRLKTLAQATGVSISSAWKLAKKYEIKASKSKNDAEFPMVQPQGKSAASFARAELPANTNQRQSIAPAPAARVSVSRPNLSLERACSLIPQNWFRDEELPLARNLAVEIIKLPIQKIMVVGNGLRSLPILLALMGKDVVFDDLDKHVIATAEEWAGGLRGEFPGLSLSTIQGKIGRLVVPAEWEGTFDLITFIDLIGDIPEGNIHNWLQTAKRLLKPKGYLVIDGSPVRGKDGGMIPYLEKVFPTYNLVTTRGFRGFYDNEETNYLYWVSKTPSAAPAPAGTFSVPEGIPVPGKGSAPRLGLENVKKLLRKVNPDERQILQKLLNSITRITFAEFMRQLYSAVDQLNQILRQDDQPYAVLWDSHAHSSCHWVYSLVKDRLARQPLVTSYVALPSGWESDAALPHFKRIADKGVQTFVIIDDASYSGYHIIGTISVVRERYRKLGRPDPQFIIVVPYVTKEAITNNELYRARFRWIYTQEMASIQDILSPDELERFISPDDRVTTVLTYFDHTVADRTSFVPTIGNLFVPHRPPYKRRHTKYYREEEREYQRYKSIDLDSFPSTKGNAPPATPAPELPVAKAQGEEKSGRGENKMPAVDDVPEGQSMEMYKVAQLRHRALQGNLEFPRKFLRELESRLAGKILYPALYIEILIAIEQVISAWPELIQESTLAVSEDIFRKEGLNPEVYFAASSVIKIIQLKKPKLLYLYDSLGRVLLSLPEIIHCHPLAHYKMYLNPYFEKLTRGMPEAEKYSIGLAAYR